MILFCKWTQLLFCHLVFRSMVYCLKWLSNSWPESIVHDCCEKVTWKLNFIYKSPTMAEIHIAIILQLSLCRGVADAEWKRMCTQELKDNQWADTHCCCEICFSLVWKRSRRRNKKSYVLCNDFVYEIGFKFLL